MVNTECSVSVIMPVHNGASFLKDALDSIVRQGYSLLEVIVVDDGSTDTTKEVFERFNSLTKRYVFQEQRGPAAARNRGLQLAQGDVIAFLDADDLWPDNKIKSQIAILNSDPHLEAVYGRVQFMLASAAENAGNNFEKLGEPSIGVNLGSGLFKKRVFERMGFFDEALASSEDVDWLMRLKESGVPMRVMQETGLLYRIHPDNMTRDKSSREAYFIKAIKKSLDRRKQGVGF